MIKRLKWNVFYGESADGDSDLSDESDFSAEPGSASVQTVLDTLAKNDPTLVSIPLCMREESSSSHEEEDHSIDRHTAEASMGELGNDDVNNFEEIKYAEWRECQVCPGKRFLNDTEVELHLKSKHHAKAVKEIERRSASERTTVMAATGRSVVDDRSLARGDVESRVESRKQQGKIHCYESMEMRVPHALHDKQHREIDKHSSDLGGEPTEDQRRRAEKRKAAVKRKLKALKRRKWEKRLKLENSNQPADERKETCHIMDNANDVKDKLGLHRRQQKREKGANRDRPRDTDKAGRERGVGTSEDDWLTSRSEATSPARKNRKPKKEENGTRISRSTKGR